jgi:hypothetical protein
LQTNVQSTLQICKSPSEQRQNEKPSNMTRPLEATQLLRHVAPSTRGSSDVKPDYSESDKKDLGYNRLQAPVPSIVLWGLLLVNFIVSILMVLLANYIAHEFHYPITLSLLQLATCWAATRWMVSRGTVSLPHIPTFDRCAVALLYVGGYIWMQMSLLRNSVGAFQSTTLTCFPLILVLQRKLYGAPWPSAPIALTLLCVMVGACLATTSTFLVQSSGLLFATGAVVVTSIAQVSLEHLSSFKSLSGRQTMALIAPTGTMLLLALFLVLELPSMVSRNHHLPTVSPSTLLAIACSCLLSVVYFGTVNAVIHRTSAVTYNVLAQCKSIFILYSGYAIFKPRKHETTTLVNFAGLTVLFLGVLLYVWLQRQNKARSKGSLNDIPCVFFSFAEGLFITFRENNGIVAYYYGILLFRRIESMRSVPRPFVTTRPFIRSRGSLALGR